MAKKVCKACFCSRYNVPKEVLENYIEAFMRRDKYSIQIYSLTILTYCPDDKKKEMVKEIDELLHNEFGEDYERITGYATKGWWIKE